MGVDEHDKNSKKLADAQARVAELARERMRLQAALREHSRNNDRSPDSCEPDDADDCSESNETSIAGAEQICPATSAQLALHRAHLLTLMEENRELRQRYFDMHPPKD